MRPLTQQLIVLSFWLTSLYGQAENYYIHSELGSDKNTGTRMDSPWKSIDKVNSTVFSPGDSLMFASDGVWVGPLKPKGSGHPAAPIVISSYGNGRLPLIIGKGITGQGVVCLYNQSYWEISNLEITNDTKEYDDRRGVEIIAENYGTARHIHIKNLRIHHIKGIPGNDSKAKRTAGIFISVTDDREKPTRFDNILIDGCTIHDVVNEGIVLNHEKFEFSGYPGEGSWDVRKFTNVSIRNNVIYNISKNAMIIRMTEGGIIEHNVCFETATLGTGNTIFSRNVKGTLFQYNEGFLNKSHDHDGSFYDPDLNSPGTVWQYSYSHDNAQGLLWLCTKEKDSDIIVRDNISENDHGFLVYFNYAFTDVAVYRNIFYAGKSVCPYLLRENPKNRHHHISFRDNLVYNESKRFVFEYRPEDILQSTKNRDNREMVNNHYWKVPLIGNYEKGTGPLPVIRKFHRGFHHQPDALDSLLNAPPVPLPAKAIPQQVEVARINGLPVFASELEREINRLRSLALSEKKKVNRKKIKERALSQLVFQKVQQEWMLKKQLYEGKVLENFDAFLALENQFREENQDMKQVVFYGPQQFASDDFWQYVMANAVESLKKVMMKKELLLLEEELQDHFKTGDRDRVDQAWEKRGYDYSIRAIRSSLLDKKYNEFFTREAEKADVKIYNSTFYMSK
ncbi:MAG: right-handed parallel beta-helix repeat-containing protein [Mangrovibacterium sp.]